jgi:hypothetical protein
MPQPDEQIGINNCSRAIGMVVIFDLLMNTPQESFLTFQGTGK